MITGRGLLLALLFAGLANGAWPAEPYDHHQGGPAQAEASRTTLTLGKVTNNPRKVLPALTEMGRYLAARLHEFGIRDAHAVLARDAEQMAGMLRRVAVDLVIETPFTAFRLQDQANARILLREWRDGVPAYRTLFFAPKDSDIQRLRDLVGKTLACEDPGSTSAYFVPVMTLRQAGLPTHRLSDKNGAATDAVNYTFAGSELNIAAWVARGRADAGVVSNLDWNDPEKVLPSLRRELRVFYETEPVLRSLMLVRGDLPAPLKERVKELLLGMDEDPQGRDALAGLDIERYDEFVGAARQQLEQARRLYRESR